MAILKALEQQIHALTMPLYSGYPAPKSTELRVSLGRISELSQEMSEVSYDLCEEAAVEVRKEDLEAGNGLVS